MGDEPVEPRSGRVGVDWRGRVTAACLGLASGVGINLASTGIGWLGVAVAAALAGIVSATGWLRRQRLPAHAPLVRYTIPALLVLAAGAAAGSLLVPATWTRVAVFTAVVLVAAAVLIPTDIHVALFLLLGTTLIGVGLALAGLGIMDLLHAKGLLGAVMIGLGAVASVGGIASLLAGKTMVLFGAAVIGLGVTVTGGGIGLLLHGTDVTAAVLVIGFGAAVAGGGAGGLLGRDVVLGGASIGVGVGVVLLGLGFLHRDVVLGAALIASGSGAGITWVGVLLGRRVVEGVASLGVGVATVVFGIGAVPHGWFLFATAMIGFGVAATARGLVVLHRVGVWRRCYRWLTGR